MLVSTTLVICLVLLVPSLVLFFFPYKDKCCEHNDGPTTKFFGILLASALLITCIIVTVSRLSSDKCANQKIDLSSIISFKQNSKLSASDVYSKLVDQ